MAVRLNDDSTQRRHQSLYLTQNLSSCSGFGASQFGQDTDLEPVNKNVFYRQMQPRVVMSVKMGVGV